MHRKDLLAKGYKSKGKFRTKMLAEQYGKYLKKNQKKDYKTTKCSDGMWEVYAK